jgi:hypothetical protein
MSNTVPVIAIFTKFESFDAIAFNTLLEEGKSFEEAEIEAPKRAEVDFDKEHRPRVLNCIYPPRKVVYLRSEWLSF